MATTSPIQIYRFNYDAESVGAIRIDRMEDIYDRVGGAIDEPHRHDYYTVVWIQAGKGSHVIDFNEYSFEPNQVYFVGPGQIHQIRTVDRPKGWVITFHRDFLNESGFDPNFLTRINLFKSYSESPPIMLKDDSKLLSIMGLLNEYFNEEGIYQPEALGATLQLFLIECIKHCDVEHILEDEGRSCILIDFKNAVEENYRDKHKVNEYADLLYITPKHLNEVVKTTIGSTAKDYIIERIMVESKRLLLHTQLNVKQIALELGFSEPLHFNNFFKKRMGVTPLQFRKDYLPRST